MVWHSPRPDACESFRRRIDETLKVVERIVQENKNPLQLADAVDHRYADKYSIVEQVCNTGIAAILNVLDQLDGFNEDVLKQVIDVVQVQKRSMTLRLTSEEACEFIEETTRTVESPLSHRVGVTGTQTDATGNATITDNVYSHKIINEVKEFHWRAGIRHSLVLFASTDDSAGVVLGSRTGTTQLITSMKKEPFPPHNRPPKDLSLTWLIKHIDKDSLKSNFEIDRDAAITPRRNAQVEEALEFISEMQGWVLLCGRYFCHTLRHELLSAHKESCPADWLNKISAGEVFVPVAPLLREQEGEEAGTPVVAAVLSAAETTLFLNEQCRSLKSALLDLTGNYPDPSIHDAFVSGYEATLVLLWAHLRDLANQWQQGVEYVEQMLHDQLVSAIGKEVESKDFDAFLRYHNHRVFPAAFSPKPFCYAIRQPNEYPSGVLSIVTGDVTSLFTGGTREKKREADPIETFVRHIPGDTLVTSIAIPLNAATTVEFVGDQYVHGWMETFFASEQYEQHFISARARQFSCFLLMAGTIGPNEFTPKDAIILQNKDEVLIPLLTTALPSAKEFKDAIQSLSPEQQRFAKSFRAMQLGTSVFGICVVQVKPQLEALLGLPPQALTKEIKLTEDLLSLFVDYQIPSNLLTYDGDEAATPAEKVAVVKQHVKAVTDVIDGIKDAQLKEEIKKTDMRLEQANRPDVVADGCAPRPFGAPPPAGGFGSHSAPPKARRLMMTKVAAAAAPVAHYATRTMAAAAAPSPIRCAAALNVEFAESAAYDGFEMLLDRFEGMALRKDTEKQREGELWKTDQTDLSVIPKKMDQMFESFDKEGALRTIILSTGHEWTRTRQENLLANTSKSILHAEAQKTETNKALDLLDALSRSGSLPVASGELHVLIGVRHSFENNVMATVIQKNMNPIEKVDYSSLLIASTIHNVDIPTLLTNSAEPPTLVLEGQTFPPLMLKANEGEN